MRDDYTPYQQKVIKRFYGNQELLQKNKIMPEPTPFLSRHLPRCSIVRPTETRGAAQGAIGVVQMKKLQRMNDARRVHAARYNELLDRSLFDLPVEMPGRKRLEIDYGHPIEEILA